MVQVNIFNVSRETRKVDIMDVLIQLISSVGFPIAMCVYMTYTLNKQTELHKQEIDELRQAIENNTLALNELSRGGN